MTLALAWREMSRQSDDGESGSYPQLARLVKEITGDMTSRVAGRRAKVSHDTVVRMWHGDRPSEVTLLKFAAGFGVDPNPLLIAAGYSPSDVGSLRVQEPTHSPEVNFVPPEGYSRLDSDAKQAVYEEFEDAVNRWLKRQNLRHDR